MSYIKRAAAFVLMLPIAASAQWHDEWTGLDKRRHFQTSAVMGLAGGIVSDSNTLVMVGCVGVGAAWEVRNRRLYGQPVSYKDMLWNVAGCATGLSVQRGVSLLLSRSEGRTMVSLRIEQ
jgi:uncharacterized protein YfiM (DUF2279 family)